MARITGKTVVVTGGSRGIGLSLVKGFLARENTVIATTRKPAEATDLQQLAEQHPGKLVVTALDATQTSSVASWAEDVKRRGVKHVDVLVNNAGVYGRRPALEDFTEADFLLAFATNTLGPFFVIQQLVKQGLLGLPPSEQPPAPAPAPAASTSAAAAPPPPAAPGVFPAVSPRSSLVANISSVVGSNTEPTVSMTAKGGYAYRASKAALNVISTTFARDLAPAGVETVLLHPGYVRTQLSGGLGWIDAEESAEGMLAVLESGQPLNGRFLDYKGQEIPW
ncbi:hypothetical protein HYH03_017137 [Edaphochlamys debaryana]|uniref:Uncharacterized protein n=1 Tax=Edaphochlamys debaryana TaxID=47281 RepID=A0A836BPL1_9CHLO|nr:hypothetical protein HYH03_017137 [Edaphochlamys debaryana]|eukprot:KAG2484047.1 hypothetical protein HYH03_017137 [Edaphochlamys debaryana]